MDHKFDAVAKAMAKGITRREALRWMSGMIGGALLGAPLSAYADTNPVEAGCRNYCKSFSLKGEERDRCITTCVQCGGDTNRLCGERNSVVCCPSGSTCVSGQCTAEQAVLITGDCVCCDNTTVPVRACNPTCDMVLIYNQCAGACLASTGSSCHVDGFINGLCNVVSSCQ